MRNENLRCNITVTHKIKLETTHKMKRSTLFAFALKLVNTWPGHYSPVLVNAFLDTNKPMTSRHKVCRTVNQWSPPVSSLQVFPSSLEELGNSISQHAGELSLGSVPILLLSYFTANREMVDLFCDPFTDAELCGEISIVSEEVTAFIGESVLFSSFLSVFSRIFAMASRFLSNSMAPEQLLGHTLLLLTSLGQLTDSVGLTQKANSRDITAEESKAFKGYFEPSGVTFSQYKRLILATDWIDVEEGIEHNVSSSSNDEYLYWLYKGEVKVTSDDRSYTVSKAKGPRLSDRNKFCPMGLLGDLKFFRDYLNGGSSMLDHDSSTNQVLLCGGSSGAKLMRIHVPALSTMMDQDESFSKSIKTLIFKSMEDKAFAALA